MSDRFFRIQDGGVPFIARGLSLPPKSRENDMSVERLNVQFNVHCTPEISVLLLDIFSRPIQG
jgi:hypothetical protein